MDFAQGLQFASVWVLNLALAGLLGILSARQWLSDAPGGAWTAAARARLDACWRPVALACLAGQFATLWSAAATMAGVPPAEALPALWTMLTATAFGKAGVLGLFCAAAMTLAGPLLVRGRIAGAAQAAVVLPFETRRAVNSGAATSAASVAGATGLAGGGAVRLARDAAGGSADSAGRGAVAWRTVAAGLLAVFAAARVANSHAAENGLLTAAMMIEWLHLVLVCLWLGGVTVAAWIVIPRAPVTPARYMQRLSGAATIAIAGILATGIFNAWHGLGTPGNVLGNPYGSALMVKVALVLVAAAMGAYNKIKAFPLAEGGDAGALSRARAVLQIESVVLACAMLAAAVLVAQQPPAMA